MLCLKLKVTQNNYKSEESIITNVFGLFCLIHQDKSALIK